MFPILFVSKQQFVFPISISYFQSTNFVFNLNSLFRMYYICFQSNYLVSNLRILFPIYFHVSNLQCFQCIINCNFCFTISMRAIDDPRWCNFKQSESYQDSNWSSSAKFRFFSKTAREKFLIVGVHTNRVIAVLISSYSKIFLDLKGGLPE